MSTDANGRNHTAAGTRTSGQYAVEETPATGTTLVAPPADPLVSDLGIGPGDSHYMSGPEAGSDIFMSVEILRDDEGVYRVEGSMPMDMVDAFHQMSRFTDNGASETDPKGGAGVYSDEQVARAETWLEDHAQLIESFLTDRYGLELDGGCDTWSEQTISFTAELDPATDTVGSAAHQLETATKAIELYNETDAGTFGSPYVWRELADHYDRWEDEVEVHRRAFAADVFSDQGLGYSDSNDKAADASPAELDAAGAGLVRTFMTDHHDAIEQAKRVHRERHGTEYTSLGRDLSLAVNNPPNTPHGRMAFGALPSALQVRLQLAAQRMAASTGAGNA